MLCCRKHKWWLICASWLKKINLACEIPLDSHLQRWLFHNGGIRPSTVRLLTHVLRNLYTVYNGIFSAILHVSCVKFLNLYEICLIISVKKTNMNSVIYWWRYCRCTRCITCHIVHRSWQNFKMKFLRRYGRELCYTLDLIRTLYA